MADPLGGTFDLFQSPFLHCYCTGKQELKSLEDSCARNSFKIFRVDLVGVNSKRLLLDRFAAAMNFPTYFGGNWDAFLDCATDLSWDKHPGYLVEVSGTESLMEMPAEILKTFLLVCGKDIPSRWQALEDEYGKPLSPTPFHFVLLGSEAFCEQVRNILSRPFESLTPGN